MFHGTSFAMCMQSLFMIQKNKNKSWNKLDGNGQLKDMDIKLHGETNTDFEVHKW